MQVCHSKMSLFDSALDLNSSRKPKNIAFDALQLLIWFIYNFNEYKTELYIPGTFSKKMLRFLPLTRKQRAMRRLNDNNDEANQVTRNRTRLPWISRQLKEIRRVYRYLGNPRMSDGISRRLCTDTSETTGCSVVFLRT